MFGHVQANLDDLPQEEKKRYHAAYCGLCRALGERHGFRARLGLTFDLTFLTLLLSSLYEPQEQSGERCCIVHPCKSHPYMRNRCTDYAADMSVALACFKCRDDWQDERRLAEKCYASLLSGAYGRVRAGWPRQCSAMESGIAALSRIEAEGKAPADAAAHCFGALMEELFVFEQDRWEPELRRLGHGLGCYIYLADAAIDYRRDLKRGSYNPLRSLCAGPEGLKPALMTLLGEASAAFERLPLVQDAHLLRNILYSGIWLKYNGGMQREEKKHG